MKKILLVALLFLLSIGSVTMSHAQESKNIPFRAVPNPDPWTLGDEPKYVVVTEKSWPTYYSSQPRGADFSKNVYIVASLGMKPNPGYTVKIEKIQREKEKITVKLKIGEPDPNKLYAQVIVHPIFIAEVPLVHLRPSTSFSFSFVDQKGKQLASIKEDF